MPLFWTLLVIGLFLNLTINSNVIFLLKMTFFVTSLGRIIMLDVMLSQTSHNSIYSNTAR